MSSIVDEVRRRQVENIRRMAVDAFSGHQITRCWDAQVGESKCRELMEMRCWRVCNPRTSAYWFEVHASNHWLMIRGDMGAMVWEREPDMLAWMRKSVDDLHYMASKVSSGRTKKRWIKEVASAWLLDAAWDAKDSAWSDAPAGARIEEVTACADYKIAEELWTAASQTNDGEFGDTSDLVSSIGPEAADWLLASREIETDGWDETFLWLREAIIKLIELIDAEAAREREKPSPMNLTAENVELAQ